MARFWLTILEGPNKGSEIDLIADEIIVGRLPDCDININDVEVSRKHFVLRKKVEEYWIEDLGSTNGTIVNGRAIPTNYRLRDNTIIKAGVNVVLQFHKDVPMPVTQKSDSLEEELKEEAIEDVQETMEEEVEVVESSSEKDPSEKAPVEEAPKSPKFQRPKKRPKQVRAAKEPKKKFDTNWMAWGCAGVLFVLVIAAIVALFYIDANFLWCDVFGSWLPGCYY